MDTQRPPDYTFKKKEREVDIYMYKISEANISFGKAVDFIIRHPDTHGIRRHDWKEDYCIRSHFPTNGHSPYLYKVSIPTLFKMTWRPLEKDMFSDDWDIVELNNNSNKKSNKGEK